MKTTLKNQTSNPESIAFTHKIGSTLYHINVKYGKASKESLEDKILRMMKNDLKNGGGHGRLSLPQADWLPEGGSL